MKHKHLMVVALQCMALVLLSGREAASEDAQAGGAAVKAEAAQRFDLGSEAYRRGDYAEASAHWRECLDAPLASDEAARAAYNLGNAAYRQEDLLTAVGWYTIALEHSPRDEDLWHNLELVRSRAGLEPADRGDLRATVERVLNAFVPFEARALFGSGLAFFALILCLEILFGGRTWKRLAMIACGLCVVSAAPWISLRMEDGDDPLLIIRTPSVALRSEPRRELAPTGKLEAGARVERVDRLPGWVRVETRAGERGWIQDSAVFELAP